MIIWDNLENLIGFSWYYNIFKWVMTVMSIVIFHIVIIRLQLEYCNKPQHTYYDI